MYNQFKCLKFIVALSCIFQLDRTIQPDLQKFDAMDFHLYPKKSFTSIKNSTLGNDNKYLRSVCLLGKLLF